MKKQTLIMTTLIVTLMAFTSVSFAGNYGKGMRKGSGDCPRYMKGPGAQWAALTQEQQSRLKTLHQKFIDETATERAAMIAKHEELKILMETSAPNQDQLTALAQELGNVKTTLMTKRIAFAMEAKKIAPELDLTRLFSRWGKGTGRDGFHNRGQRGFHGKRQGQWNCPASVQDTVPADTAAE